MPLHLVASQEMNTRVLKERVTERLGRKLCAFVFTLSKHRGTLKGEESAPVWIMLGSMENNVALPCCEGEPELGQHIQTTCEPVFTCLQVTSADSDPSTFLPSKWQAVLKLELMVYELNPVLPNLETACTTSLRLVM